MLAERKGCVRSLQFQAILKKPLKQIGGIGLGQYPDFLHFRKDRLSSALQMPARALHPSVVVVESGGGGGWARRGPQMSHVLLFNFLAYVFTPDRGARRC